MIYNFDLLNAGEKEKLHNIVKMLQQPAPTIEPETEDLSEKILFIRRFGQRKLAFYSDKWYESNPKRTSAIYFKVRANYIKNKRIALKKRENAQKSLLKLLKKCGVAETVK